MSDIERKQPPQALARWLAGNVWKLPLTVRR